MEKRRLCWKSLGFLLCGYYELLQKALKINPKGIDSNYFYGDFLLSKSEFKAAETYFANAIAAPVRSNQAYSDNELKKAAKAALQKAKQGKKTSLTICSRRYSVPDV